MAVTTTPDLRDRADGRDKLEQATGVLRGRVHRRAVEVANDVLAAAMRSSRRSLPIRALPPHDRVWVSDQILISRLREQIDDQVAGCSVGHIYLRVDPDATLAEVTIEMFVQYGEILMDTADRVRQTAGSVLMGVLGAGPSDVEVILTHVHISDVTRGDPRLVDPSDET